MLSRTGQSLTNPDIQSAYREKAEGHYNQFMSLIHSLQGIVAKIRDRFNGAVEIYVGSYLKNGEFGDSAFDKTLLNFANPVMDALNKTTKNNPIKSVASM